MKNIIKKLSVIFLLLSVILSLTACMTDTSGCKYELLSSSWSAVQKGGSEISLMFDDENAYLTAKSGNDEIKINGKYVSDDTSFIIFNTAYPENYRFFYELNGENLSLTYCGDTIVLVRQKL